LGGQTAEVDSLSLRAGQQERSPLTESDQQRLLAFKRLHNLKQTTLGHQPITEDAKIARNRNLTGHRELKALVELTLSSSLSLYKKA
jgi:hypothetical protein